MAFDARSNRNGTPPKAAAPIPDAPMPGAELWHPLREDGIQWKGQVLIVGTGADIPALLVATLTRLVLLVEGNIALDVPREWLRPEPKLLSDNGVRISITPVDLDTRGRDTDRITIRVRAGRGEAARLVSTITGRIVSPRESPAVARDQENSGWKSSVGASTPMALPPLPDFDDPLPSRSQSTWPPVEQHAVPTVPKRAATPPARGIASSSSAATPTRAESRPLGVENALSAADIHAEHQESTSRSKRAVIWSLRTLILLMLVGTGWYLGYDRIQDRFDVQLPAAVEKRLGLEDATQPSDVSQIPQQQGGNDDAQTPVSTEKDSDGTNGPPNGDTVATDEDNTGVGGDNGEEITPADPVPTDEPTNEPVPTDEPEPTDEPAPTDPPATEIATEEPVTEEPTDEPATEEPTVPATPTDEPATEEPTVPATPTDEPATEEPATLEPQAPSVEEGSTPEQAVASGGFRYTITGVQKGETIADVPALAPTSTGEWVVLTVNGENWSGSEQVFDMSQFTLYADGQEVKLDVGTQWVAGELGLTPAYGNTESILWADGESHQVALTFLIPKGAQQLTLVAGDQTIDLTPSLESSGTLVPEASPVASDYIEATVVEVIDAETIVIEKDGIRQTVRYLGIDVPGTDDCFSADANTLNAELVEGKTVRIERQATDVDARGNWVRDVWVAGDDGAFTLVSQALVAQGAATVAISEPNTRFAGWLTGAEAIAESEGLGLWGACEQPASTTSPTQAVIDQPRAATFRRQRAG